MRLENPRGRLESRWKLAACIAVVLTVGFTGRVAAGPWAEPGDVGLRHDLQMLSDYGLTNIPLTTWPLAWADIARELLHPANPEAQPPDFVVRALSRVQRRIRQEMRMGAEQPRLRMSLALNPVELRTFEDTPREVYEANPRVGWMGERFAARLSLTGVVDADDGQDFRFDGSYASAILGNWALSIGQMPRWWGPGLDGSLILGTNARPVPMIIVERNTSTAFKTKWLSWIGPWKLAFFIGELEHGREVPDAKLVGMRLNFKPLKKLELGLSRSAQWGGKGRPQSFKSFVDLVGGRVDNIGSGSDPGNQLAGFDFRLRSPVGNLPYAIYGQAIGEDEAGGLPSKWIVMGGLETWGELSFVDGSYRVHLEYSDTAVDAWQGSGQTEFNVAYEHVNYRDGYRYFHRSLGHYSDNDSRVIAFGGSLVRPDGTIWNTVLRYSELNRDDVNVPRPGGNRIAPLGEDRVDILVTNRFERWNSYITLGLGTEYSRVDRNDDSSFDARGFIQLEREF